MRILATSAMIILLGACTAPSASLDVNAGLDAFSQGEFATAVEKFAPLSEQTDAKAQFALGVMYSDGSGVAQDDSEAVRWLRKSAEQRNPYAQSVLGTMYMNGRGVETDYVKAHMWFSLAVAEFHYKPGRHFAENDRDAVARKMTDDQIVDAKRMAQDWLQVHGISMSTPSDIQL